MRMVPKPYGRVQVMMPTGDLPPHMYKRYAASAPMRTHWRQATCAEVECDGYLNGFVTFVDVSLELGRKQHYFLTHDRERTYTINQTGQYTFEFIYPPGNPCFQRGSHRTGIGRPPFLLVHNGDWRASSREPYRHTRVEDFVDDMNNNSDWLLTLARRG